MNLITIALISLKKGLVNRDKTKCSKLQAPHWFENEMSVVSHEHNHVNPTGFSELDMTSESIRHEE